MTESDEALTSRLKSSFGGIIRVPLMSFENEGFVDSKKVSKLISVFKIEGCQTAKWPVAVILDSAKYQSIVSQDGCSTEALRDGRVDVPILPKNICVTCVQGKHRLQAGRYFLPNERYWWHAMLFVDVDDEIVHHLRCGDPQATRRKDGEIYRLMRTSQLANETAIAQSWESQLCQSKSNSKLKDIKQLYRAAKQQGPMQDFLNALDDLLPFDGLWPGFQIGCFHRLLTLRCPEEMTTYLKLIHWCWSRICGEHARFLDPSTVGLLENRMPVRSRLDREFIHSAYTQGQIFSGIRDPEKKAQVLESVLSLTVRIPSLRTFLEDTKYLEVGASAMKALLPKNAKGSVRQTFGLSRSVSSVLDSNILYVAYLKVWLFALRNFPELTDSQPRKEPGKPKPVCKGQNAITWYRFAELAVEHGFDNIQTRELLKNDGRRSVCEAFLRGFKDYSTSEIPVLARDTRALMAFLETHQTQPYQEKPNVVPLSVDCDKMGRLMERRCGRPFEDMFKADRDYLYYESICNFALHESCKLVPSSFDIQCEIILSFFHDRTNRQDNHMDLREDPTSSGTPPAMQDIQRSLNEEPYQTIPSYPFEDEPGATRDVGIIALQDALTTTAVITTFQSPTVIQDEAMQMIHIPAILLENNGTALQSKYVLDFAAKCASTNEIIQSYRRSSAALHDCLFVLSSGRFLDRASALEYFKSHGCDITLWTVDDDTKCRSIVPLDALGRAGVYWLHDSGEPILQYKDGKWHWCPGPDVCCIDSNDDEVL